MVQDFSNLGFKENCYQLLKALQQHLKWCKIWYIKEEGPRQIFESLKLRYLALLSERLQAPTEYFEEEKNELLTLASELFMHQSHVIPCFALVNLYGGEEKKKYLSTRKLQKSEKNEQNLEEDSILIKMLMIERNLSNDQYQKAIAGLKDVISMAKENKRLGLKPELLSFFLAAAFFQRTFCRTRTDRKSVV